MGQKDDALILDTMPADYPFELLGDRRFQMLCQSLLLKERPNVLCFPVGQPDGGRDAVAFPAEIGRAGFAAFQVKFAAKGLAQEDPGDWLIRALRPEVPKIEELARRGATEYVVMTNVRGSSHLDSGAIDRVQRFLEGLPLPATCLWRDDLNRRLDNAWDLKWSYPELMGGADLIRVVFESGLAEDRQRRTNALKSFVQAQYQAERQVRFKQVELESALLELFVDVPLVLSGDQDTQARSEDGLRKKLRMRFALVSMNRSHEHAFEVAGGRMQAHYLADSAHDAPWFQIEVPPSAAEAEELTFGLDDSDEEVEVGAARFLLDPTASRLFPSVVLEGAPGQGKSTVTQLICQLYRVHLLSSHELRSLRPEFSLKSFRLPIRADLRDFATWLSRKDPFGVAASGEPPSQWEPTLEAFLCAMIRRHSGGASFDVSDLQEAARLSAILLVLDGLDEVADSSRRTGVVAAIEEGVGRLRRGCASLQVVVTSRPAAFASTRGLAEGEFPRLQLGPMPRERIEEYAAAWLRARRIGGGEGAEFLDILRSKLDLPHLRELARNPMQLAILLSLIHTRGVSLPDKRTALYESYMDVFFSREAEKSEVVRKNRDLLLALHGYLAWLLHAEAESGTGDQRGRIAEARLFKVVAEYLREGGHDEGLATSLFSGVTERVVALVSNVEGTFEFQVQPLREFFAARHLYKTAPYSFAGSEKPGTKPERFDAIVRNSYWLNVARFFAGFADAGELSMLVDRIRSLCEDTELRKTSHPAAVTASLLTDWVFSQAPKSVNQVADLLFDEDPLRLLLAASPERGAAGDPLLLADECGRPRLHAAAVDLLKPGLPWDFAQALLDLVEANASERERLGIWRRVRDNWEGCGESSSSRLVTMAMDWGIVPAIPRDELESLLGSRGVTPFAAEMLRAAGRFDVLAENASLYELSVDVILAGNGYSRRGAWLNNLDAFAQLLDSLAYHRPTQSIAGGRLASQQLELLASPLGVPEELDRRVRETLATARHLYEEAKIPPIDAAHAFVDWLRQTWGERWIAVQIAYGALPPRRAGGGVRAGFGSVQPENHLLDSTRPLVARLAAARQRAQDVAWWERQLRQASPTTAGLACFAVATLATDKVVQGLVRDLEPALDSLDEPAWRRLVGTLRRNRARRINSQREQRLGTLPSLREGVTPRAAAFLALTLPAAEARLLYSAVLQNYRGDDYEVLRAASGLAVEALTRRPQACQNELELIRFAYERTTVPVGYEMNDTIGSTERARIAAQITARPREYPMALLAVAERYLRQELALSARPVAELATQGSWFAGQ